MQSEVKSIRGVGCWRFRGEPVSQQQTRRQVRCAGVLEVLLQKGVGDQRSRQVRDLGESESDMRGAGLAGEQGSRGRWAGSTTSQEVCPLYGDRGMRGDA